MSTIDRARSLGLEARIFLTQRLLLRGVDGAEEQRTAPVHSRAIQLLRLGKNHVRVYVSVTSGSEYTCQL